MKHKHLLLSGLFVLLLVSFVFADGGVKARITTDKDVYTSGEDIIVSLELGPDGVTNPTFWNTQVTVISNDNGKYIDFIPGGGMEFNVVDNPLYASFDKHEVSSYHVSNDNHHYGWWILKTNSQTTLTTYKKVAKFKAKALSVTQPQQVSFTIDTSTVYSDISNLDPSIGDFVSLPLSVEQPLKTITINPGAPLQNTVAVQYLEAATLFSGMETVLDGSESQVQKIGSLSSLFITYFKASKTPTTEVYSVKNQTYLTLFNNINSILNNNNLNTIGQISNIAYVLKQAST